MWSLHNRSRTPYEPNRYWSVTGREEYDCKEEQVRTLTTLMFKDFMGKGKLLSSDSSIEKWRSLIPGSMDEAVFKSACGISKGAPYF